MNKKIAIVILSFAIIAILAVVSFWVVWDKRDNGGNVNVNQNINQDGNTNQNANTNQPEEIDYSGKTTKDENGWKTYKNPYWGIEFKFQDAGNRIRVDGGSTGVYLSENSDKLNGYTDIDISCYDSEDFDSLQEYIIDQKIWDPGQGAPAPATKFISLNEKINNNGLKYLRIDFKASDVCYPGQECEGPIMYKYDLYTVFFETDIYNDYCKKRNYTDTGYIRIKNAGNNAIYDQAIHSLKFIEN